MGLNKVILVELDFPRKSKLPENIQKQNRELAQNFGVRGYPSIYFVQPKKNSKGIELCNRKVWIRCWVQCMDKSCKSIHKINEKYIFYNFN